MPDNRTICLIDSPLLLERAFRELGCTVHTLRPDTGPFVHLPEELDRLGVRPDMVFQCESLGRRIILTGLSSLDCPLVFWATDPHLNAHWHGVYARLFDLTCSTQRGWIPRLKRHGAEQVHWLPTYGHDRQWIDMADRLHDVAFVGRVTPERPARQWMVELLRQRTAGHDFAFRDDLHFMEMMELYRNARIVPNESILGEINFRLFEGASCGCLVLNQDLGEEQAELYEPGREIDTYADVVELDDKLQRYLRTPRLVEAMGRAAYARTHAEHLPLHRAERVLRLADGAALHRATGEDAAMWTALTAFAMWESGQLAESAQTVLSRLASVRQGPESAEAVLRAQAAAGLLGRLRDTVSSVLAGQFHADSAEVNLAGSMAALRLDDFDTAKVFRFRHLQAKGRQDRQPPRSPAELLTVWAKDLKARDRVLRPGFPFDAATHLPTTASECLMVILKEQPEHLPTLRLLDTMLRPVAGLEQARVGFLSILTLHERDDWRLALEIGLADLKSYRLDSGLEELHLARHIARTKDEERAFVRALAARDASGLIMGRLGG